MAVWSDQIQEVDTHRETSSTFRNRIQSLLSSRFKRSLILGCDELWDFSETARESEMIEASFLKLTKSPHTGLKVESTALTLRAMRASGSRPLDSESITACECLEENADNWETSDVMKDIEVV